MSDSLSGLLREDPQGYTDCWDALLYKLLERKKEFTSKVPSHENIWGGGVELELI